jgi:CubicO group peptidase (beta-lactamase class C family)
MTPLSQLAVIAWLLASTAAGPGNGERLRRIESQEAPVSVGRHPRLRLTIDELMRLYHVPGLSIAVIDGYRIAWAKGYGVTASGGSLPVTTRTLFMAGSIAKTPAAAGALALAQKGTLSLDEDVNRKLTSWKVPENEFTSRENVTLRRILSHTAGLNVHFFPGHVAGEPLPTLVQILNGEQPANTEPVRVTSVPGDQWRYSGGGVMVEQQLMIDVTGRPFPALMRELLFDRIGMADSTYEQPLPPERAENAAAGTHGSGAAVPGKWNVYPEMAAGGLWTTPSDLARFAIEIALSKHGRANRVLSEAMTRTMLEPQVAAVSEIALGNKQHVDRMGLGFFLGDASRPDLFGHIGDDEGFQAMLLMFADSGQGVVVMANSENGIFLGDYIIACIAREYGWKEYQPPDRGKMGASAVLRLVARDHGSHSSRSITKR